MLQLKNIEKGVSIYIFYIFEQDVSRNTLSEGPAAFESAGPCC